MDFIKVFLLSKVDCLLILYIDKAGRTKYYLVSSTTKSTICYFLISSQGVPLINIFIIYIYKVVCLLILPTYCQSLEYQMRFGSQYYGMCDNIYFPIQRNSSLIQILLKCECTSISIFFYIYSMSVCPSLRHKRRLALYHFTAKRLMKVE